MYPNTNENLKNMKESLLDKDPEIDKKTPKEKITQTMHLSDVSKICLYLGFISFGGPISHIGAFKKILIEENKFLSEQEFTDLFNICNVIPGPSSSQLLTAIMTLKTKSVVGGIISFMFFNMPALIVMIIIANLLQNKFNLREFSDLTPKDISLNYLIYLFIMGICQAAVANILLAAYTLSEKIRKNYLQNFLLVIAAMAFALTGNLLSMILIMLSCGFLSILKADESMLLKVIVDDTEEQDKNQIELNINNKKSKPKKTNLPYFLGFPALLTWFIVLILFISMKFSGINFFLSEKNFQISEAFFRIGSVIVGGGHVVIPMMMTEFVNTGFISQEEVLKGFSFVSLMPGPMFNIAGYIGALINGTFAGFLSAFLIFLPGMLFMFFMIGNLKVLNEHKNIQFFIRGASTAGIGFIFTAVFTIFMETSVYSKNSNIISGLFNIALCYYLMKKTKILLPFVLFIGAGNYILLRFVSFYVYK